MTGSELADSGAGGGIQGADLEGMSHSVREDRLDVDLQRDIYSGEPASCLVDFLCGYFAYIKSLSLLNCLHR